MPRLSEPSVQLWLTGRKQQLVCASDRTHSSSSRSPHSAAVLQGWTDHATGQTHRWTQTTSHDDFSPQAVTQISNGSKEGISGQMCGTFAVWCWTTRLRGVIPLLSSSHAVQQRTKRRGFCSRLFQTEHRYHRAHNALRFCLHQNQCQQWC